MTRFIYYGAGRGMMSEQNYVRFIVKTTDKFAEFKKKAQECIARADIKSKLVGFRDFEDDDPATEDASHVSYPINSITQDEMARLSEELKKEFGECYIRIVA